jgi:hypothetical protein
MTSIWNFVWICHMIASSLCHVRVIPKNSASKIHRYTCCCFNVVLPLACFRMRGHPLCSSGSRLRTQCVNKSTPYLFLWD